MHMPPNNGMHAIALGAIFNGHHAASVADGISIDSYTPQGTQAFLSVFALSAYISSSWACLVSCYF
jgi:hypothetical protein